MNEILLFPIPKTRTWSFPDSDLSEILVAIAYPTWPLMTWACFPHAIIALLLPPTLLSVLEPVLWSGGYHLLPVLPGAACWSACQSHLYDLFLGFLLSSLMLLFTTLHWYLFSVTMLPRYCPPTLRFHHHCLANTSRLRTIYGHFFLSYSN